MHPAILYYQRATSLSPHKQQILQHIHREKKPQTNKKNPQPSLIFLSGANLTNVKHGLLFALAVKHVKLIARVLLEVVIVADTDLHCHNLKVYMHFKQ